eukprot:2372663-Karenia_brevis.AAC.1
MWLGRTCSADDKTFLILDKSNLHVQKMQAGNFDMVNMLTSLRNNKRKELMQQLEAPDDDEKDLL